MNAVITAGGRIDGAYAAAAGTAIKALAPVRGARMIERVVDAVRGAGIDRIAMVAPPAVRDACADRVDRYIDEGASGNQNVQLALRAWSDDEPLLYVTSDLPYITAETLRDAVLRATPGVLTMPVAECDAFERRFPDAPPFGITLAGERIVNAGVFIIPAGASPAIARRAAQLFDARKAPLRMAGLVGPSFLLRMLLGRLTIAAIEKRAGCVLGYPAMALRGCAPELAYDADTFAEYRYASMRA